MLCWGGVYHWLNGEAVQTVRKCHNGPCCNADVGGPTLAPPLPPPPMASVCAWQPGSSLDTWVPWSSSSTYVAPARVGKEWLCSPQARARRPPLVGAFAGQLRPSPHSQQVTRAGGCSRAQCGGEGQIEQHGEPRHLGSLQLWEGSGVEAGRAGGTGNLDSWVLLQLGSPRMPGFSTPLGGNWGMWVRD